MEYKNEHRLEILAQYCIGYTIAFVLLSIFRGSGTTELGAVQFEFMSAALMSALLGIVFGSISGYAQILTEQKLYKKISFRKLLILKLCYALLLLFLLVITSYIIVTLFFKVDVHFFDFLIEPGSFAIYLYILMIDGLMFILRLINLMLGKNNLSKLLQGKFYDPREEDRIFMFLDLKIQ